MIIISRGWNEYGVSGIEYQVLCQVHIEIVVGGEAIPILAWWSKKILIPGTRYPILATNTTETSPSSHVLFSSQQQSEFRFRDSLKLRQSTVQF